MSRMTSGMTVFMVGTCLVASVALGGFFAPDTVGERFRKALKEIEGACAKRKLEPNEVCGAVAKLKPADPLATEEGRFAHAIQIPNPVPADSGYRPGMTSQEYFAHLCRTEAGEFIYKTVDNVEGLFMMRPREEAMDDELSHLYALEDPYGHTNGEADDFEFLFVTPSRYQFIEIPLSPWRKPSWGQQLLDLSYTESPPADGKYERYGGYDGKHPKTMTKQYTMDRQSHYGFTWRGITRPHDRELGITGGELLVLDLQTLEVLGVRRGFARSGHMKNATGIWWLTAPTCPAYGYRGRRNKDVDFSYWFVGKVLRPKNVEQSFRELMDVK